MMLIVAEILQSMVANCYIRYILAQIRVCPACGTGRASVQGLSGPHTVEGSAHSTDRASNQLDRMCPSSLRLGATWQSVKHS